VDDHEHVSLLHSIEKVNKSLFNQKAHTGTLHRPDYDCAMQGVVWPVAISMPYKRRPGEKVSVVENHIGIEVDIFLT
jgi:hypothetical protein